jgi:hypothetical protein
MNPNGVKSAIPILNDNGDWAEPVTATPALAAPLYPGGPPGAAGVAITGIGDVVVVVVVAAAGAGAAAISCLRSATSCWVRIPFLISRLMSAWLLSWEKAEATVKAEATSAAKHRRDDL